jgi:general secretion pathway protein E/type IV pilus assembly protein PilB
MSQRIGEMLIENGLLTGAGLAEALASARAQNEPLIRILLREGRVPEEPLLRLLAEQHHLPFARLRECEPEPAALKALTARQAAHYHVMPLRLSGTTLTLAVSNPFELGAVEDIGTLQGYRVERVVACAGEIQEAIRRHYGVGADTVDRILEDSAGPAEAMPQEESHDLEKALSDASVVNLVNQMLQQAIAERATDLHFERYRDEIRVRRRVDGLLHDTPVPTALGQLYPAIIARIKLMGGLNIVERRLPQDGRARVRIGARDYDLRISVMPTLHGENVVVRILPTHLMIRFEELGLGPRHRDLLETLLRQPHGIIFVTGPTGSGKSTTLYACLNRLNTSERKIVTIEDPVEYELKGVTQTPVQPRIDLTFARALRGMLRHDPDIMMVGEVRDRETAEITIQTALTGHLVFSTLHTNDAAAAAVRLIDMGIDPYLVASTVRAFIAQRLVRVLCPACKEPAPADVQGRIFYRARGCSHCSQTGFFGRVAIYEFMMVSRSIQELILHKASAPQVRDQAIAQGMVTLADDGWEKVAAGITTAEEVLRVTQLPD